MSWLKRFLYKRENINVIYKNGVLYSENESVFEALIGKNKTKVIRIIFNDKNSKRR